MMSEQAGYPSLYRAGAFLRLYEVTLTIR